MLTGVLIGSFACGILMFWENREPKTQISDAFRILGTTLSTIAASGLIGGLVL